MASGATGSHCCSVRSNEGSGGTSRQELVPELTSCDDCCSIWSRLSDATSPAAILSSGMMIRAPAVSMSYRSVATTCTTSNAPRQQHALQLQSLMGVRGLTLAVLSLKNIGLCGYRIFLRRGGGSCLSQRRQLLPQLPLNARGLSVCIHIGSAHDAYGAKELDDALHAASAEGLKTP